MQNAIKLLLGLHGDFFENDMDNMVVTGIGFALSAASMLAVLGLYML